MLSDKRGWTRFKSYEGWGIAIRNGNERKVLLCRAIYSTRRELYEDNPGIKNRPEVIVTKVRITQGWKK